MRLIISFFSNDHETIHVHTFYEKTQINIKYIIISSIITQVNYIAVVGYNTIPKAKMKDLESLMQAKKYDIEQLWFKFYVL